MEETKRNSEDLVPFLESLEKENEEELTKVLTEVQTTQQRLRELDFSLKEEGEEEQGNMSFFSPVGVLETKSEQSQLTAEKDELSLKLQQYEKKLEEIRERNRKIIGLKQLAANPNHSDEEEFDFFPRSGMNSVVSVDASQNDCAESSCDVKNGTALHILETQEYDRNRMARDLHDSSVQVLTGMVHKAEFCMRLMDMDTVRVKLELQTMIDSIKSVINEMRDIIYDLRPMSFMNLGLISTVDNFIMQLQKNSELDISFSHDENEPELLPIWNVTVFRVIQEACNNVVKHAKAKKMKITVRYYKEHAKIDIRDDGIGFDVESQKQTEEKCCKNFGLSMMKERVILLGGTLSVESIINKGTKICATIPLQRRRATADGTDKNSDC